MHAPVKASRIIGYFLLGFVALTILGFVLASSCAPCEPCPQGNLIVVGFLGSLVAVPVFIIALVTELVLARNKKPDKNTDTTNP